MRNRKIRTFYTPSMVMDQRIHQSYSKSPQKPKLLIEKISELSLDYFFQVETFPPFNSEDFLIAHTEKYVNSFFKGIGPLHESNSIPWSKQLATSVTYTNASLYNAIKHSIENPEDICLSPTSGFHHASPTKGSGFCTFRGQVISSLKLYNDKGLRGAYLDLDQHLGNSIEDSRHFCTDLSKAIPEYANFNPSGSGKQYLKELEKYLSSLEDKIVKGEINYIVWCHGADSHEWDDLGGRVSTEEWIQCSVIFYSWVKKVEEYHNITIPLTIALFGGYRNDDYNSVLSLHIADLVECLNILSDAEIIYKTEIKPKKLNYARR